MPADIFTIIDPINYKKYIIDTGEIKNWIDVASLKYLLSNNQQAKEAFNRMPSEEKEAIFSFIDRHETEKCFNPQKWLGINGVNLELNFSLKYDSSSIYFYDEINTRAKDRAFFSKKIFTLPYDGEIKLSNTIFPIKTLWAFSEDFIKIQDLEDEDLDIFFKGYFGDETDSTTKVIINKQSQTTPIHFNTTFKKEECWLYNLAITFANEITLPNIMWYGVPSIKKLYDFFYENSFVIENKNTKVTEWHRNDDVIQYFHTPIHFYEPFLLIKQHKGKKDVSSRNKLGASIFNAMTRSGLLEDIYLYKGNSYLNNALDCISTTNKVNADNWLTDAINTFQLCTKQNMYSANANAILCEWLKNRIGLNSKNTQYATEHLRQIILRLLKYRNLEEILDFLLFVSNLNAKSKYKIGTKVIENLFPLYELEIEHFVKESTLSNIVTIWDEEFAKSPPDNIPDIVKLISIADTIGAKKTTTHFLKTFFKYVRAENNFINFPEIITDDFFNICIKYGYVKDFIALCNKILPFFDYTKHNLNFGDLSYAGRKDYRWKSYLCCMGEYMFTFYKIRALQQINYKKQDEIAKLYSETIRLFHEGTVFIDLTENYNDEQLDFITRSFLSLYNFALIIKDNDLTEEAVDFLEKLWHKFKGFSLYQKIFSVFPNRTRDIFATSVCNNWKRIYGSEFYEKKEVLPDLIFLYISTEQWEGAIDSLDFALDTYTWSFEEFNELYKLYLKIKNYSTIPIKDRITQRIEEIINVFLEETSLSQNMIRETFEKIHKILAV